MRVFRVSISNILEELIIVLLFICLNYKNSLLFGMNPIILLITTLLVLLQVTV
jgi:hypothetical protein